MKLSRIPGTESTVKHSFNFKQSTSTQLAQYHELYMKTLGVEVSLKDVVEQMLLDFMAEDKAFQKSLKQKPSKTELTASEPAAEREPAASTTFAPGEFGPAHAQGAEVTGYGG